MRGMEYGSVITRRGRNDGGRRRKARGKLPVLLAFLLLLAGVAPAVAAQPRSHRSPESTTPRAKGPIWTRRWPDGPPPTPP
ncbi:hypothetical protein GCM10009810_16580 [Nostocoides vanveenii]|uniref:Uncharacterized protein n=1 Tax=Nostocoides vanveenii TaxID=330835 RepID=A0ABN2KK02_9MICO